MNAQINFTKINHDLNGNPRFVCHFSALITEAERVKALADQHAGLNTSFVDAMYKLAVKKANKIGGKRYHNKKFGGGIVFQAYTAQEVQKNIDGLMNVAVS
jgi:hypothetical protein